MAQSLVASAKFFRTACGVAVALDEADGAVTIGLGEMFVVPKGVEHKPFAASEVKLMLIEPKGVVNTGDAGGEMTAEGDVWV